MTSTNDDESDNEASWSISVKTIGGGSSDFTVQVSPEDKLHALYNQIESATGITAAEQRLIYRGRLIGNNASDSTVAAAAAAAAAEPKIRDIAGLENGHTIHLVKRNEQQPPERSAADTAGLVVAVDETTTRSSDTNETTVAGSALLAALLGMGNNNNSNNSSTSRRMGTATSDDEATGESSRLYRSNRALRRRTHYRLSTEDLVVPDPGSAEHVRQGLLTLHTVLPPVRTFFPGQWIDCRDTVNQWLEATVMRICRTDEILGPEWRQSLSTRQRLPPATGIRTPSEPVVSADDLDGRRRLLLEPCDLGETTGVRRCDDDDDDDDNDDTRSCCHILLIHYNGWPHRWDEWIRSDSERLRPFRVRTRHTTNSPLALPTPQTPLDEAPPTFIRASDERRDRAALVPELSRMVTMIGALLEEAATAGIVTPQRRGRENDRTTASEEDAAARELLPWLEQQQRSSTREHGTATAEPLGEEDVDRPARLIRQLQALVPLLDRLGRTMVDAAPHVAALASSLVEREDTEEDSVPELEPIEESTPTNTLSGLLSLLNRDRRRPSSASNEDTINNRSHSVGRRQSNDSSNMAVTAPETGVSAATTSAEDTSSMDPDYADFHTGMVNTTRGEIRSGPRRHQSASDDVANLLGAYLAAASLASMTGGEDDEGNETAATGLGRLLRERGNGGGIDIHIHAVVTSPGGGQGGTIGILTPMGHNNNNPSLTSTNGNNAFGNLFSSSRDRRSIFNSVTMPSLPSPQLDEDDMGIFAELYSETPDPVNPGGPTVTHRETASGSAGAGSRPFPRSWREQEPEGPSRRSYPLPRIRRDPSNASGVSSGRNERDQDLNGQGSRRRGNPVSRLFRRAFSGQ
jgi:hypothetical protein